MTRLTHSQRFSTLLALIGVLAFAANAEDFYSPGGWSTLHHGPANRKISVTAINSLPFAQTVD